MMLQKLKQKTAPYIDLLLEMSRIRIYLQYKSTILGLGWILVNPLIQMAVVYSVFRYALKVVIPNYEFYLYLNLLFWNAFAQAFSQSTASIVNQRQLIKKASFHYSIIPLSVTISNIFHLLIGLIPLLGATLFVSHLFDLTRIMLIIPSLLLLFTFTAGLSLLTSALNVQYRDVSLVVQVLLYVWFYLTPIVYTIDNIPYPLKYLILINPLTSIVQLFQYSLLGNYTLSTTFFGINFICIVLISMLGLRVFGHTSKYFNDHV